VIWAWNSVFKVEEGHAAVLTRFGAVVYEDEESTSDVNPLDFIDHRRVKTFKPGVHWIWPWEKVHCFSTMERVLDLSGPDGGRHAMTADGTILRIDSKIRFKPLEKHLYAYMFGLKNPMEHIKELFTCLIRNEIANFCNSKVDGDSREFVGSYAEIRRDRNHFNFLIENFCQKQIGSSYGVQFNAVDLIDILPPPELEKALNGIQSATTEAKTIYSRAEADSRQRIAAAEQGVEIAKTRAQAVAVEIQTIAGVLEKLLDQGSLNYYLQHRRTELMTDSRLTFVKKGELPC
ncbi:MAG TPA: SPFH domain-containing protein, partial [Pseudobdellovibrionaceae bacterium]